MSSTRPRAPLGVQCERLSHSQKADDNLCAKQTWALDVRQTAARAENGKCCRTAADGSADLTGARKLLSPRLIHSGM